MRHSYGARLLREERRQRGDRHGWQTRLGHLFLLTWSLVGLYALCTFNVWRHPRPSQHVWIDDVLVEVIEERWPEHARHALLCAALISGSFWALLRCVVGTPATFSDATVTATSPAPLTDGFMEGRGSTQDPSVKSRSNISTIAVPAGARRRPSGQSLRPLSTLNVGPTATERLSVGSDRVKTFDARRPMRTDRDLTSFLAYEVGLAQQQQQQQQQQHQRRSGSVEDDGGLRYRVAPLHTGGGAEDGLYHGEWAADTATPREVIRVSYEGRTQLNGPAPATGLHAAAAAAALSSPYGPATSSSTLPWAELNIHHVEEALQRTREWVSEVCQRLITNVDQCDRWFNEHQIEAYDCHHSLQELLPAPPPPMAAPAPRPTGMWGAPAAPAAPPAPTVEQKLTALMREKMMCRQGQRGIQELDTSLRYDQRLALEAQLDVSGTFPSSALSRPSNAELTAARDYVVERLRTFAKQRFLVSYNGSGGDPDTWRSGFPCDAHLLLHVLRVSVDGLSEYVRFGYQAAAHTEDLALYVGDTGEPYFYVRFRQGSTDMLLSTRQGPPSLFEAVLAFAAVIHTYYRDVFGGVRGTVDLNEVGLLKVVTGGRRPV